MTHSETEVVLMQSISGSCCDSILPDVGCIDEPTTPGGKIGVLCRV
jgi:hypothetical protein